MAEQFDGDHGQAAGLSGQAAIVDFRSEPPMARQDFRRPLSDAGKSVDTIVSQGSGFIAGFLASIWSGGRAVFSLLSLLIITPVVAFYLLLDWDRVVVTVDRWIPLPHRETVHGLARDVDNAIAGFVRGQAVVCLCLAAFYSIGLTLTGLNSGFLIGLMTGLLSFIPFVGAPSGFLVAAIVAVAQFWPEWTSIATVAGVFVVGQGDWRAMSFHPSSLAPRSVCIRCG